MHRSVSIGSTLFVATLALAAEDPVVREADVLAALDDRHPALIALSDRVRSSEAELVRARTLENPVAGWDREALDAAPVQTTWSLSWTPPLDGRRAPGIRVAERTLASARRQLDGARADLRVRVRTSYARWYLAEARRARITVHLERADDLARTMQARAEAGEVAGLSARRLSLVALEVRGDLARVEAEAVSARGEVAVAYPRLGPNARPEPPGLPEPPAALDVAARADLEALALDVERAEAERVLSRRFFRAPALTAGWQTLDGEGVSTGGPVYGLSWHLPLFDRLRADRIEAEGRALSAAARRALEGQRARAELASSLESYARLRGAALEAAGETSDLDAMIEGAVASYRLGEAGIADLVETLRSVLAARIAALDLEDAALEAHRRLERVAGRPVPVR